jgi:hypothetical protein
MLYHLSHAFSPFHFINSLDRVLCFCLGTASDYDLPTLLHSWGHRCTHHAQLID